MASGLGNIPAVVDMAARCPLNRTYDKWCTVLLEASHWDRPPPPQVLESLLTGMWQGLNQTHVIERAIQLERDHESRDNPNTTLGPSASCPSVARNQGVSDGALWLRVTIAWLRHTRKTRL